MRLKTILLSAVLVTFMGTPAHAEARLKDLPQLRKTPEFQLYLNGVGVGMQWSNTMLKRDGARLLFNPPSKLILTFEMFLSLVDQEVDAPLEGWAYDQTTPVELILINSLKHRFPVSE